jgi:hypothetical protein
VGGQVGTQICKLEVKVSTRARLDVQLDIQLDGQLRLQLWLIRISGLLHLGYGTRRRDFRSCACKHLLRCFADKGPNLGSQLRKLEVKLKVKLGLKLGAEF